MPDRQAWLRADSGLDRLPGGEAGQISPKLDAVSTAAEAAGQTVK